MSVDDVAPDDPRLDLDTTYRELTMPSPVEHGGGGQFLIDDVANEDRADEPSLYDELRATWYDVVDDPSDEPVRLGDAIEQDGGRPDLAVTFRSSPWDAGEGTGDDYSPWYKYHLTLRPLDPATGEVEDRAPLNSCSLTVIPHVRGLVQQDGSAKELQHGPGTMLHVQTTWVADHEELVDRAADVLDAAIGYDLDRELVDDDSKKGWKVEDHHRFHEDYLDDVVEVLRRSEDLIALEGGKLSPLRGERGRDGWEEYAFTTSRFDLLGIPNARDVLPPKAEIGLKVYLPDQPERLEFPLDQPKIEAWLKTKPGEQKAAFGDIPAIHDVLKSVVLSHLTWAGVPSDALLEDEKSLGSGAEPFQWHHPQNRREQLRKWYESQRPDVFREATRDYRDRAGLAYDVLQILTETAGSTYAELGERTGASYSAIQRQARRLEDQGICERLPGNGADGEVLLCWSAPEMGRIAGDVLTEVRPDDTPEDRRARAEQRRAERDDWRDLHADDDADAAADADSATDSESEHDSGGDDRDEPDVDDAARQRRRFVGLDELDRVDVDHLPPLVDAGRLDRDEIRVHADGDPAIS